NPPYSAQQSSQNNNNQNLPYPTLDARIRDTYAAQSVAANKKNLYDSYIRAIRWASDRIGERGIVSFVTNGSFLDHNNMDGLRKCLSNDFSHLYLLNLRGFIRGKSKDLSKREGGSIFDILTGVAITIMVKDPAHVGLCELCYHDIGDFLSREEKLQIIDRFGNIGAIDWQRLYPNDSGDWINQRDPAFDKFMPLTTADSVDSLFGIWSNGLLAARDAWVYNYSRSALSGNMARMSATYNEEVNRYEALCRGKTKDQWPDPEKVVEKDPKKISWTSSLLPNVARGRKAIFDQSRIVASMYRPFSKCHCYYDNMMNHRVAQWPKLIPSPKHKNVVISSIGVADRKGYSAFITDQIPDYHLTDTGTCFPLYWYEKTDNSAKPQGEMFGSAGSPDADGYVRRDAITDWALDTFLSHYSDASISKEDIFWYVYGLLHSPEYKQRFSADIKKMLPRIPFAQDFWAFSNAGRKLGGWHLNYESVEPYSLAESHRLVMEDADYRVSKMVFGKKEGKPDKTTIIYNAHLTLRDIPLEAYDYVVNGKSAIEWIMERYQITTDKTSGIQNDPNQWSGDPKYILNLLKRIVRVSVESCRIVKGLPPLLEARG
ncbi:MAG: type ISP restriction/modification enzyme, partial [Acidithiobacillus sp.]